MSADEKIKEVLDKQELKLDLSGLSLSAIPAPISELTHLEELDLSGNNISEIKNLSTLGKLKTLILTDNQIEKIHGLEELAALEDLRLDKNQIRTVSSLEHLTKIRRLDLDQNPISRITNLQSLTRLENLYLTQTLIDKIEGLSELKNLEILFLDDTQISTIQGLDKLTNLKELRLNKTSIDEIQGLSMLKKLETLSLDHTQISVIEGLDELRSLKEIWLHNTRISKISGLSKLTNLEILVLHQTEISEIVGLSKLTKLSHLDLSATNIKEIKGLDNLKELTELRLHKTKISKIKGLKKLSKLEKLTLDETNIGRIERLENLTSLKELWLSQTPIKKIEGLNKLVELTELHLHTTSIKRIEGLSELTNLTELYLHQNHISKIEGLENLSNLKVLYLHKTKISKIEGLSALKEVKVLALNSTQISKIEGLENLTKLEKLYLADTQINEIANIDNLTNLELLSLHQTQINRITGLKPLSNLKELFLYQTNIKRIEGLKNLNELELLRLDNTQITKIEGLENLTNLKRLFLHQTQITNIEGLDQCKNLELLALYNSQLVDINQISVLPQLKELYLDQNGITDISSLSNLTSLNELDLSGNRIADLRPLAKLIKNRVPVRLDDYQDDGGGLFVGDNPLADPPLEIIAQGNDAILAYWKQIDQTGEHDQAPIFLNEARVLIVGEGESGKTSLQYKLLDRNATLPSADNRTRNIIKKELSTTLPDGQPFKLHLWDFGGQNIQYYAHQFFLSTDAIYLLVTDERRQSHNLVYWLHIIDLLGKGSPVFLLQNQKSQAIANTSFNAELQAHFPVLQQELQINLKEVIDLENPNQENPLTSSQITHSKRLSDLLKRITHEAANMPLNTVPRPWSFRKVRDLVVSGRSQGSYMTLRELQEKEEAPDRRQCIADLTTLNLIGECVYLPKDPLLREYVFLNPQWIIDAMYKLVDNTELEVRRGQFTEQEADQIWDTGEYSGMTVQLLRLLRHFYLCYQVPASNIYIAPMLLPTIKEMPWQETDSFRLSFRYRFLPYGILTRLICRLYDWIKDNQVWRDAVIFSMPDAPDTQAYIRESFDQKQIVMDLKGSETIEMLQRIRDVVSHIHKEARYGDLEFEEFVPCPCPDCTSNYHKEEFRLGYILNKIALNRSYVECRLYYREVPITAFNLRNRTKNAFVLVHPADRRYLSELEKHLSAMRRRGELEIVSEVDTPIGQRKSDFITSKLSFADVVFLLLSPNLNADEELYKYALQVIERSQRQAQHLVPIRIADADYGPEINDLQCLPRDGTGIRNQSDQDQAWKNIADETGGLLFGSRKRKTGSP